MVKWANIPSPGYQESRKSKKMFVKCFQVIKETVKIYVKILYF